MARMVRPRASNAYSVAHVVKTNPNHSAAAMVAPRAAVCGPVAWMIHESAMARMAVMTSATTYPNHGGAPEAFNSAMVRPMPASHGFMNMVNHAAPRKK